MVHIAAPFTLPELRLPTAARLNPHLGAARESSRRWARAKGMLDTPRHGDGIWTQADLDAHDYPLMCAYIHPDADVVELELITEWYVWVFYFDDYFLVRFKKTGDRAGAVDHLERLAEFMSSDAAPSSTATNPVEAGLADLWTRTVPTMSSQWRSRFTAATRDLLGESLTELDSITAHRVPDPIEYIELRRRVGGAPWSAALVEHTVGEIPRQLVGTRPLRVLTDTFADAVHLRNDLFSYQREVQQEGEPHNAVLVVERFFGWPTQRAAQLVADLITSRLRLFEHIVSTELPELLAAHRIETSDRRLVEAYVWGLRDWQTGGHEWHSRSSRYMNAATRAVPTHPEPTPGGPGVGAARLVRPVTGLRERQLRVAHPLPRLHRIPEVGVPYPLRLSPHLDRIRAHAVEWAERMGICEPVPGVPNSLVWTREDVVGFDLALCAAGTFPDADVEELEKMVDWLTLTYFDDYFPAVYGGADRQRAAAFLSRLAAMFTLGTDRPAPRIPLERMLADLWDRTTPGLTPDQRNHLRAGFHSFLSSYLWEHHYNTRREVPDPIDFVEMSRSTFGGDFMVAMSHIRHSAVPARFYASTVLTILDNAIRDCFRLLNDALSYTKEAEFEGKTINGVVVFGHFLDLSIDDAVDTVVALHDSRVRQVHRLVGTDIPAWCDHNDIDTAGRTAINGYTTSMEDWLAVVDHWHHRTSRYTQMQRRRRLLRARALAGPRTHPQDRSRTP